MQTYHEPAMTKKTIRQSRTITSAPDTNKSNQREFDKKSLLPISIIAVSSAIGIIASLLCQHVFNLPPLWVSIVAISISFILSAVLNVWRYLKKS